MANKLRKVEMDVVAVAEPVPLDSPLVESVASIPNAAERAQIKADIRDVLEALEVGRATCREAYTNLKQCNDKMAVYTDCLSSVLDDQKVIITDVVSTLKGAKKFQYRTKLDDNSLAQLSATHNQMVDQEVQLFKFQIGEQKSLIKDYTDTISDMLKAGQGVWLPNKIFWCFVIILANLLLFWGLVFYASIEVIHSDKLSSLCWVNLILLGGGLCATVYVFRGRNRI